MKRLLKCDSILLDILPSCVLLRIMPATIPRIVVRPASYRYLCLDFFKKCPNVIASIIRKSMIKISVDIKISVS